MFHSNIISVLFGYFLSSSHIFCTFFAQSPFFLPFSLEDFCLPPSKRFDVLLLENTSKCSAVSAERERERESRALEAFLGRRKVPKKVFSLRRVSRGLQEDRWAAVTFKMRTDTHSTCLSTAWQSCQQCREPWNACKSILRIATSTHNWSARSPRWCFRYSAIIFNPNLRTLDSSASNHLSRRSSSLFFRSSSSSSTMWEKYYARH